MPEYININWGSKKGNWGDTINHILCEKLSGKQVRRINKKNSDSSLFRYYCCGSILGYPQVSNCEIWGSGFIKETAILKVIPKKIHAVRGPISREKVLRQNIECPEIYGDPALLYPLFYNPKVEKKYRYGIIPHYVDKKSPWVDKYRKNKNVKIINIIDPTINRLVDDIKSCEIILSSTLHGVICGDAYGVPSYYIKLSDKVVGDGFKFRDYFASVKRPDRDPIIPKQSDNIKDYINFFHDYKIDIDLSKLYNACPFKKYKNWKEFKNKEKNYDKNREK